MRDKIGRFTPGNISWSKLNPDYMSGDRHWNWQGGKPKCKTCRKTLGSYKATYCNPCATNLFRKVKPNCICEVCGKYFYTRPSHIAKGKGKYCSREHFSIGVKGKYIGENNHSWRGEGASYGAKHIWIAKHYGKPDKCETCGTSGLIGKYINWANISGEYRREKSDWKRLCKKCHVAFDDTINRGWQTRRIAQL